MKEFNDYYADEINQTRNEIPVSIKNYAKFMVLSDQVNFDETNQGKQVFASTCEILNQSCDEIMRKIQEQYAS